MALGINVSEELADEFGAGQLTIEKGTYELDQGRE
jgi:hypothetical protein